MGAPHFHLRRAWLCKDEETGLTITDQTKVLLKAGILPPNPEKKISKKNNPKMTVEKVCRNGCRKADGIGSLNWDGRRKGS